MDLRVGDPLNPTLIALRNEVEEELSVVLQLDVSLLHRCQPIGLVLLRVSLRAYAKKSSVEETSGARKHLVARKSCAIQVRQAPPPYFGQTSSELEHALELLLVSPGPPLLVVEVLPSAGGIHPNRLQVAVWIGTDPYIPPGGRDGQVLYARQCVGVLDRLTVGKRIGEATTSSAPDDSGARAIGASQPGHGLLPFP
jgi:hypothetical protein